MREEKLSLEFLKQKRILTYLAYFLLSAPKVNLISVGSVGNLRIDDFYMLFLLILSAATILYSGVIRSRVETSILLFVFVASLELLLPTPYIVDGSLIYSTRILFYFMFFHIGAISAQYWKEEHILLLITASALGIALYDALMGLTINGIGGGPWEAGAIFNLLTAVFLTAERKVRPLLLLLLFLLFSGLIAISGSRTPLITEAIIIILYGRKLINWKSLVFVVAFGAFGASFLINSASFERIANNGFTGNTSISITIPPPQPPGSHFSIDNEAIKDEFAGQGGNISWLLRATKWADATGYWASSPETVLFGLHAGSVGRALDGGWLRLVVETGIIGTMLFVLFLRRLYIECLAGTALIITLITNNVFIDIYLAYKYMSIFFFFMGIRYAKKKM